ncbi:N-acetylneuraminate synthase [Gammaproteobacteria bacterium]|nr:N-acetylneuraminate synthase [Gammaproteobacteria bacterium]
MSKTLIIAEAGVNHNGDLEIAKELIHQAAIAGADLVKFQTFTAAKLLTLEAPKADYQQDPNALTTSNYEMLESLELSKNDHLELIQECKKHGIEFFSTAFDEASLSFLLELGMSKIKIPSGEITNKPLLEFIAQFDVPVIMSTGMADLNEIQRAIEVLCNNKLTRENITILHCTSQYPASFENINLRAITSMKKKFNLNIGYSDHTLGAEASIAAVSLGATIIEKHITLDSNMPGPDHKASMEPKDFQDMVSAIRNIERGLGNGIKAPTSEELEMRTVARKSLVANKKIEKGEIFTQENLTVKRPGNGVSPMSINEVIGTKAVYSFEENDLIKI